MTGRAEGAAPEDVDAQGAGTREVIAGYMALSATVLAGRTLFGVATGAWRWMWSLRDSPPGKAAETPRAA